MYKILLNIIFLNFFSSVYSQNKIESIQMDSVFAKSWERAEYDSFFRNRNIKSNWRPSNRTDIIDTGNIVGNLTVTNKSTKYFEIQNSSFIGLNIENNYFNSAEYMNIIRNSKIWSCEIYNNYSLKSKYLLLVDTIRKFSYVDTIVYKEPQKINTFLYFNNCYFKDSYIKAKETFPGLKIRFEGCHFEGISLSDMEADSIEFYYCTIDKPIQLYGRKNKVCYISFYETSIENILFTYDSHFKLYFDSSLLKDNDYVNAFYESAVSKFKSKSQYSSLEKVAVEWQRYKYKTQWDGGGILNFIDEQWWYYGYRKYYIIYWTLGFFAFFFIGNLIFWKYFKNIYPIIPSEPNTMQVRKQKTLYKLIKKFISVLIFTSYIFFSFRVIFEKLSFKQIRWTIWFFAQFVVGIVCLFFLINAVFKL